MRPTRTQLLVVSAILLGSYYRRHNSSGVIGRFCLVLIRRTGQTVRRAAHTTSATVQDMRVDHRRPHVFVSQEFLHRAYIIAIRQQVPGK